jgi:hypothetical protein
MSRLVPSQNYTVLVVTNFNSVTCIPYPSIKAIVVPAIPDGENFSREVTLRTKLSVSSKFGEENVLDALSLDESDNVPQLSRSEAFVRMLQKGNTSPQAQTEDMDVEAEEAVEVADLAATKVPQSTPSLPRVHNQAETILGSMLAEATTCR